MPIELGTFNVASIALGFLGGIVCHYLAKARAAEERQISEQAKAAASFRAAFAPTLAAIDFSKKHRNSDAPPLDVDEALKKAFFQQATEFELFRPYVPKNKQKDYQKKWDEYYEEVWNYGFVATTFNTDIEDPWKVYKDLIHGLLQFTQV